MDNLNFMKIVKMLLDNPRKNFEIVLNQPKYKYLYLFPALFGLVLGLNGFVNKYGIVNIEPHLPELYFSVLKEIIRYLIICYIYSWIVYWISRFFNGYANGKLTFAVVSYSLIPLIIGSFLILALKIGFFSFGYFGYFWMYYTMYLAFLSWSIYTLTTGNLIINGFSLIKSFISSSSLIIIFTMIEILQIYK